MNHELRIGIDIGTIAVKTCLISNNGDVLATFDERYPIQRFTGDPADWMAAVRRTLDHLRKKID